MEVESNLPRHGAGAKKSNYIISATVRASSSFTNLLLSAGPVSQNRSLTQDIQPSHLPDAQSRALEQHQSKIANMWDILHTGLLARWIRPASAHTNEKAKRSRIAKKFWSAYKKMKVLDWLSGKDSLIRNAKPHRNSRAYKECYVLLLVWELDDIGGALKEAEALKKELEERWGFYADIYRIPFIDHRDAQQTAVESAVLHFIEHRDGNSNLLFVHYGGHGDFNYRNEYILAMPHAGKLHQVRMKPIRERLRECQADVGIFLDACYSEAGIHRSVQPHTVEIIAACEEKKTTPGVSKESFTNGILRVLHHREDALNLHELSEELGKLNYPSLLETPVHHPLKLSVWGSIKLRRSAKCQDRYSDVTPLFPCLEDMTTE